MASHDTLEFWEPFACKKITWDWVRDSQQQVARCSKWVSHVQNKIAKMWTRQKFIEIPALCFFCTRRSNMFKPTETILNGIIPEFHARNTGMAAFAKDAGATDCQSGKPQMHWPKEGLRNTFVMLYSWFIETKSSNCNWEDINRI